jgi:integrase/recombinase XerD
MLASPMTKAPENALILAGNEYQTALRNALRLWAESVTSASTQRRDELLQYKQKVVDAFFAFTGKHPTEISPLDIEQWRDDLKSRELKPTTIYTRICFLSSFFEWALRTPPLKEQMKVNPVRLAMPKAPKPYQTESTKSWTDDELQKIVEVVKAKAEKGDLVGKRDYALLLFYLITGMRRQEVIGLRGKNLKLEEDSLVITSKVKGGDYVGREVRDEGLRAALLDYLSACDRLVVLKTDSPLWTRHDRAGKPGAALSSHAFVKNLKQYAQQAGVGDVHLHQARHSYARIIAEESGSITDTQDALGHRNAATTRIYVQRIAVKKDKYSEHINKRIQRNKQ